MRRLVSVSVLAVAAALLVGSLAQAADEPAKAVGTISGKVVDKEGKAVKGANVGAMDVNAKPADGKRPEPVARAVTADDGSFKLENVPAGKYNVRAMLQGTGFARTKEPVEVKAGEETKLADALTLSNERPGGGRGGRGGRGGAGGGAAGGAETK